MTRSKGFHKSKSRKRSKAGKKGYATRMANEAAAAADDLPPPAAVAAPDPADPAPAKRRRRRRKGPFKGYKVDVERDGVLYVLNRFGKAYVRWLKQGGNRQGFIRMLTRNYGKEQTSNIMTVLKEYGTGTETTRKGKAAMQT